MSPTELQESEIRPEELMKGQAARFAADVERLLARKNEFVQVSCPACGSKEFFEAFDKSSLSYVNCQSCGTTYITPRPSQAVLDDYYAKSENYAYWNKYIFPASEGARREKLFRPRAERLAEMCKRLGVVTGTILEVGCGFGIFCEEMGRIGLFSRVLAVEPTPDLAETCRKKGLEVIEKPIERVAPQEVGRVDVVASFEVIEHIFSPVDFLRQCFSLLSSGGLLVLSCPNGKGFDISLLGPLSGAVDPEHLNYFNPASMRILLSRAGFETVEVSTPGRLDAELVRKRVLDGEFKADRFLRQVLVERWEELGGKFQDFLADNVLSSHMWTVARKPAR